ncbi:MAG: tetratricopeptide repeat protein, partial [Pseudomonadota bacterium]
MARTTTHRMNGPKIGLIMTTALASVALAGCTASAAPRAETSFNKAQAALEKGKADKAIMHAEAAVLAEPRNSGFRALLGAAYLEAGRFEAAATSFGDAIELGDNDPRTVLSYALAKTAIGDGASAIELLSDWEGAINPADLGLAFALAGKPERGVHILVNTLRSGQNTAKVRQNLAYSYALAGNWRGARVMAAEDVPADQLDQRLSDWAANAKPEDVQRRVANLLQVQPSNAGGVPSHLALANFPSQQAMVAEAAAQVEGGRELSDADLVQAEPSQAESMAFKLDRQPDAKTDATVANILAATTSNPVVQPIPVAKAPAPKPVAAPAPAPAKSASVTPRFVSNAVVQKIPEKTREER